jgi:hypothetical protein
MSMKIQIAFPLSLALMLAAGSCQSTGNVPRVPASAQVGQVLDGGYAVRAIGKDGVALEKESAGSGEILLVGKDGKTTRIRKVLGTVAEQPGPEPIVTYPQEFWDKLSKAKNDILAEQLLSASPDDPSFRQIQGLYPRLMKAETFVGRLEDASEICVAADGSVAMDVGFFAGDETVPIWAFSPFLRFRLNNHFDNLTNAELEMAMSRGLLNGWLPATEFIYRQQDTQSGWEQLVFAGLHDGKPGLFIRFRIANLADVPKTVDFALEGPGWGGSLEFSDAAITVVTPVRTDGFWDNPKINAAHQEKLKALGKFMRIPLSASRPHAVKDGRAVWSFALAAKQTEDLYLFLPGGTAAGPSAATIPAPELAPAFFSALKGEFDTWSRFLAKGTQITLPEPGLEDVFTATFIQSMVAADGDEPRGGFMHYEAAFPFCTMHQIRLMLDTGHADYARRYLADFMKRRILENGRFYFDAYQSNYQVSDVGDFLMVLSRYYWQTGDASLLNEYKPQIGFVLAKMKREREESMKKFPAEDPRHGMIAGSVENDVPDPDYLFTNNAPIWAGMRDYAQVLSDIAAKNQDAAQIKEAMELTGYVAAFHQQLRHSFETAALVRDAEGKPYFFHIVPNVNGSAEKYLTNSWFNCYRRFQCQPRTLATDFLTDDEIRGFYKYQAENDSTILGVRRWQQDTVDDFVSFDCDFQRARLGMSREYLMKFFAYIQMLAGNGTWTAFEEVDVWPQAGNRARACYRGFHGISYLNEYDGQHATIAIARMARDIYSISESTGGSVLLAGAISKNWLATGKPITARKLGTRYGLIDLTLRYDAKTRTTSVEITVEPGKTVPEIRVRLRDPQGGRLATVAAGRNVELRADKEEAVLKNVAGTVKFIVKFAEKK